MEGLIFGILRYELATGYPPGSCQWFYATLSEKTYKSRKKSHKLHHLIIRIYFRAR